MKMQINVLERRIKYLKRLLVAAGVPFNRPKSL